LFAVLRLVNNREIMGEYANGKLYNVAALLTAIVVSSLSLFFLGTQIYGWLSP
jgi:Mn2+/Fe2+ NRAMP family transporter